MAHAKKLPDLVYLTFMAIVPGIPDRIKLKEHSLDFAERDYYAANLVSGFYGAHSKQMALVIAAEVNKTSEKKKSDTRAVLVDTRYLVDNFMDFSRQLVTHESLEATGWLHMDRLGAELREELKEEWLALINKDFGSHERLRMEQLSFSDIALAHPRYVNSLFSKRSPRFTAVIHPVHPTVSPGNLVWAATVRYDKDRFKEAQARFMPTQIQL